MKRRVGIFKRRASGLLPGWWRKADRKYGWRWRLTNGMAAGLILFTAAIPTVQSIWEQKRYELSETSMQLVGRTDASLSKQLTYDASKRMYQFNKDAVETGNAAGLPAAVQKATAGASDKSNTKSYALDVHEDFSKGVTFTDTNSQLSFSMLPDFKAMPARTEQGHIVFPLAGGNQAVYSLKNNGLKEDILVPEVKENTMTFNYTLDLPETLEVRVIPDGSGAIGIYSADPMFFGDINYGTPDDQKRVEKARIKADKTELIFGIPAPIIKAPDGGSIGDASARFELSGNKLSVVAEQLKGITTPITIDPSVVVTSTSDFQTDGNNEGMIDFTTSGQVMRGGLTGGTTGAWTSTTATTDQVEDASPVFYNNYMYIFGGKRRSPGATFDTSRYAAINSDGSIGTWNTTTVLPYATQGLSVTAYNGYMYMLGGYDANIPAYSATSYYAKINSNGTLGSWLVTSTLPTPVIDAGITTYQGYIYLVGGAQANGTANYLSTVYYAAMEADGSLGSWNSTTSLTYIRNRPEVNTYNGYMYILAGSNVTTFVTDVQYAKINSDGTIGAWNSTNNFTNQRYGTVTAIYNGYIYLMGGWSGGANFRSDTQYAQINSDGSLSPWTTTTALGVATSYGVGGSYNGYLYYGTGYDGSVNNSDLQYSKIDTAGMNVTSLTSATVPEAKRGVQTVAYGGYLYVIGGDAGSTPFTRVSRVALNSDGATGTISSMVSVTTARTFAGAFAYRGYLYVVGGCSSALASCTTAGNNVATVYSATVTSSTGNIGTWTAQTSMPGARYGFSTVVYNDHAYILGGLNGSTFQSTIYSADLAGSGAITSWSTVSGTYDLPSARAGFAATVNGGTIYIAGGCTAGNLATCTTRLNEIRYAQLDSNGGFSSTWTNSTAFTNARYAHGLAVTNGNLYIVGGYDNTTVYADVQFAKIASNGSVGTWNTGTAIPAGRWGVSSVAYNNAIYTAGGVNGVTYSNTLYASYVNNGGQSFAGSWTTNASDASSAMGADWNYGTSFVSDGFLYLVGGYTAGPPLKRHDDVWYAPLSQNGSVGTWVQTASNMVINHFQHSMAVYNGYVYVMGGSTGTTQTTAVEYAKILPGGGLSSWTQSPNAMVGSARVYSNADAYNGYLYFMGGSLSGTYYSDVQYAQIGANGSVGTWSTTTAMPAGLSQMATVATNGYLYFIGGTLTGSVLSNAVYFAPINSNGTIGSWVQTTSLTYPKNLNRAFSFNGVMYLVGQVNGAIAIGTRMESAPINSNGTLGQWYTAPTTYAIRGSASLALSNNGVVYIVGGFTGGTNYIDIQYGTLMSMARVGRYSKLMSLTGAQNVSGVAYTGTLHEGQTSITYRSAGGDAVFSSPALASDISASTCTTSVNSASYLWVLIVLDDSRFGSTYADAESPLRGLLTDFTVNYIQGHPDPNIRLRHGQTLQVGTKTRLDTCFP